MTFTVLYLIFAAIAVPLLLRPCKSQHHRIDSGLSLWLTPEDRAWVRLHSDLASRKAR